ncbi:hypothetical protein N0V85_008893 [Neurospora sp. IMI 360204]|nr:hypothetical protein N0V85_008893 [Neurospora sp. IMI 360204]
MVEFMARRVFGLDKEKAHIDNTVSVTGIMKLVLDAIQGALDAKLEQDPIPRWPATTFEIIDANETSLPSHEANHDSNKKLSPSQIERVEEYKSVVRKLLAQVTGGQYPSF